MILGVVSWSFPFPTPHWPAEFDPAARTLPSLVRNKEWDFPVQTWTENIENQEGKAEIVFSLHFTFNCERIGN